MELVRNEDGYASVAVRDVELTDAYDIGGGDKGIVEVHYFYAFDDDEPDYERPFSLVIKSADGEPDELAFESSAELTIEQAQIIRDALADFIAREMARRTA